MNILDKQSYINEISHIWSHLFLTESAKLAESKPYLSDTQIEREAQAFATIYMYYTEKAKLNYYRVSDGWRFGCE